MDRVGSASLATSSRRFSFRRLALKTLGVLALYIFAALMARVELGRDGLMEWLSQLSMTRLLLLLLGIPVAWLVVEFFTACFAELVVLVRSGGRTTAGLIGQLPFVGVRALGRMWRTGSRVFRHWEFDRRYRRRVLETFALSNDRGLGLINAARVDLEQVYIELQIASGISRPGRELLGRPVSGRQPIWRFLDAMRAGRGLVLLGVPGSGKTTLLQHLLLVFAAGRHRRHEQRSCLPIFLELRNLVGIFERDARPALAAAIRTFWDRDSRMADLVREEPDGWLERRLRSRRVLMLIDGLDEVPQAWRVTVAAWVEDQMRSENHRLCRFVLTSRPAGYESAPLQDATVLEVQAFSSEQVVQFIDRWYVANELETRGHRTATAPILRHAEEQALDLRERLRKSTDLHALASNPLLLTMVCMIHRYRGALPGTRSQLYGEICQVLLERWRQAKGIADEMTGEQKLAVLRPLAREFMEQEAREMREQDIASCITRHLRYVGYLRGDDPGAVSRFLRSIQSGSGLLLEKEPEVWSFAHKTFQEYLVSDYWLRVPAETPLWSKIVTQEWWREACLLYAARADVSQLVLAALDANTPPSWSLAFQCLMESHGMHPEVRSRAEETLRTALRSEDWGVFTPAANALHHTRQSQLKRVREQVEQRATLVTQAEYQLFLNSLDDEPRQGMMPPHWKGDRFEGDPEAAVLGVFPWQALGYARSLGQSFAMPNWKLPTRRESLDGLGADVAYWCEDHQLGPGCTGDRFPDGMVREGVALEVHDLMSLAHSLSSTLWLPQNRFSDVAMALAYSLKLALAMVFGHQKVAALDAAEDVGFTSDLILELRAALDDDLRGRALLEFPRRQRPRVPFSFSTPSSTETDVIEQPAEYRDRLRLTPRQELLNALTAVLPPYCMTLTSSVGAWREYARCLLRMPIRHVGERKKRELLQVKHVLDLVERRQQGAAMPCEGISLVRVNPQVSQ